MICEWLHATVDSGLFSTRFVLVTSQPGLTKQSSIDFAASAVQASVNLEKPRQAFTCRSDVDAEHLTILELVLRLGQLGWKPQRMPTGGKRLQEKNAGFFRVVQLCSCLWHACNYCSTGLEPSLVLVLY